MANYSDIEKQLLKRAEANSADYSHTASGLSDQTKAAIQAAADSAMNTTAADNSKAAGATQSDYSRFINANNLEREIQRQAIEKSLADRGISLPATSEAALNLAGGNANQKALSGQSAMLSAISQLLQRGQTQTKLNQASGNSAVSQTMNNAALSNQQNEYRNALSGAASSYGSAAQSEAQAAKENEALQNKYNQILAEQAQANAKQANSQQNMYNNDLIKLIGNGVSYSDALGILSGEGTEAEKKVEKEEAAKKEAEQQKANQLPVKPTWIDNFIADYDSTGNSASAKKVQAWNHYQSTQLKAPNPASLAQVGSWVDPDKSVRNYGDYIRNQVNQRAISQDQAIKGIISYYGKADNTLTTFKENGATGYAVNDPFRNSQIGLALREAGLMDYIDKHKDSYYRTNVGSGNGSWIIAG